MFLCQVFHLFVGFIRYRPRKSSINYMMSYTVIGQMCFCIFIIQLIIWGVWSIHVWKCFNHFFIPIS